MIHNQHLAGEAFFWEGGSVGVVLSHGFTATTAEVRLLGRILHERGFTVAGPLLPGHYTRPEDLNRVRWQDWVAAYEDCYHQVAGFCRKVFAGGESVGGLLALYHASRHPGVAGVLAYAPALRLNLPPSGVLRLHLMAPFIPYLPKPNMDGDMPWQGYPVNPLKGALQVLRLQRAVRPRLARIHQPVLVVQGRLDPTVHPEVPDLIYREISSTLKERHWMEHSTHCVILDQELHQVAEVTLRFMEKVLSE